MEESLTFSCLSKKSYSIPQSTVRLAPLKHAHMEMIRQWRNEQILVLRQQEPLTKEQQELYWKESLLPLASLKRPSQVLFAIEEDGQCIGYCGLTNIDWMNVRCELSFLLDTAIGEESARFQTLLTECSKVLLLVAFHELQLQRMTAEVYGFRKVVLAVLKSLGFSEEGRLRRHVRKGRKEFDSVLLAKRVQKEPERALLLTSISKKTALITSIRNAMGSLGEHFCLIGCDTDAACLGQYSVDQFWCSPVWTAPNAAQELLSFCKEHRVVGIIPTRDAELQFFAGLKRAFSKENIEIHCSLGSRIAICQDKWKFMRFCMNNGISVIPSYLSCCNMPHSSSGYVVKERFSFTPKHVCFFQDLEEVERALPSFEHPLIQPRLEGVEYSIDVYRSRHTKKACSLVRRRDIVVDSEAYLTTPVVHVALEKLAIRAADALNLYGHILFQAIETENKELYFIECNPRIGGASTAAFVNGLDSVEWFIAEELLKLRVHLPAKITWPLLPQVRIRADVALIS